MVDKNQVSENRKIIDEVNAGRAYKEQYADEYKNLRIRINERNVIPCTGCKYCVDVCPRNIAIPDIFNLYNTYETLSLGKKTILGGSVSTYRSITHKKGKAGECLFCGKCEKRCPQKISIRDNLQKAKAMFEDNHYYSIERNAQILVYLLKENNIKVLDASDL